MILRRTATICTILIGLFISYVGIGFLVAPESSAAAFGLPGWPRDDATGFLNVKGIRDLGTGLVIFVLLALRRRLAIGWVLLAMAVIPLGDGIIVLAHGGDPVMAFGVHMATSGFVVVTALSQLRVAAAKSSNTETVTA